MLLGGMLIFISGATAGLGAAMAQRFITDGHDVIGAGRRLEKLQALQKKLGENFSPLQLDVRNKNDVIKSVQSLKKDIDVLVNNAGLALGLDPIQNVKIEDWEVMVDTNIKGVLNLIGAILPSMVKRNQGHIINLGSVAGEFPYPGGHVYGASKAFLRQLSLNMRSDLLGTAVRVTNVEPGLCGGTEFSEVRFKGNTEKAKAVYKGTKPLTAEDIAETVSWIISRPPHVNINTISLMPTCQAFGPFAIDRK